MDLERVSLPERLRRAMVRGVDGPDGDGRRQRPAEELAGLDGSADDKERLVGLIAAPVAAAIGLLVTSALVAGDPPAALGSGLPNPRHVDPAVYHDLTLVLLALALGMLASAWFRKRLYLGAAMALYGLAVFNLHWFGFGVPFVLAGAWLLVRAYKAHYECKQLSVGAPGPSAAARGARPPASKRYTPPRLSVAPVAARTSGRRRLP